MDESQFEDQFNSNEYFKWYENYSFLNLFWTKFLKRGGTFVNMPNSDLDILDQVDYLIQDYPNNNNFSEDIYLPDEIDAMNFFCDDDVSMVLYKSPFDYVSLHLAGSNTNLVTLERIKATIGVTTASQGMTESNVGIATTNVSLYIECEPEPINTLRFNVNNLNVGIGGDGNTNIKGTLDVGDDFDINNGKFTVDAGTGDTYIDRDLLVNDDLRVRGNIYEYYGSSYWNIVSQYDIGTAPNQVPLNQYLGELAFSNSYVPNALKRTDGVVYDVYVNSSGNVGVGTTNPAFSSYNTKFPSLITDTNSKLSVLDGNVTILGDTGNQNGTYAIGPYVSIVGIASTTGDTYPAFLSYNYSNVNYSSGEFDFYKAGLTSAGIATTCASDTDTIGSVVSKAYTGTQFENAAFISFQLNSRNITGSGNHPSADIVFTGRNSSYTNQFGGNEWMRIKGNNGNIGIGTTNATSKLHIIGNTLTTGIATVGLGTTSSPPSNSQMSFELTSDTNLRIKVRGTDGVLRSANITLA